MRNDMHMHHSRLLYILIRRIRAAEKIFADLSCRGQLSKHKLGSLFSVSGVSYAELTIPDTTFTEGRYFPKSLSSVFYYLL